MCLGRRIIACLVLSLVLCTPLLASPVSALHEEADGLVLRQGGVDIVTVWQGVVTGQLSLQPGSWSPEITVILLDPAGVEFQPDEPEFSLGWALGDSTIADLELMGVWSFRLAGEANGVTGLTLSVLHEGHADFSSAPIPVVSSPTSGVASDMRTPLQVLPNLPNPFNPSTTIAFRLQERSAVTVSVHDVRGRLVTTLLDDEERDAGESSVVWDGRDASGKPVESGVYLCRVEAGSARELRKMTLLK